MKRRQLNYRWDFWVPNNVADWDAPDAWEVERLASMEEHLKPGMVLYDIGTEHGWMSAIYGSFVGHENIVLVEPSPFFWPNIRMTWELNGFKPPRACFNTFAGEAWTKQVHQFHWDEWPPASDGPECNAMAYLGLPWANLHDIATLTIDEIRFGVGPPDAITIDVEGAELLALRGAHHTLDFDKPLVWVSVHPDLMERDYGYTEHQLFDFMDRVNYDAEFIIRDHESHFLFRPR